MSWSADMLKPLKWILIAVAALWIASVLLFIAIDAEAKEPVFEKPFEHYGLYVTIEKGLQGWCIPHGTDECFERGARCGRTENYIVCLKYRKT